MNSGRLLDDAPTLLAVLVIAQLSVAVWLHRRRPRQLSGRYSDARLLRLSLPFSRKWRTYVAPSDVEIIAVWRRRVFIAYTIAVCPMVVVIVAIAFFA